MWFPGGHGSVGGGGDIRGLSDAAFLWVLEGAKNAGLKVDTTELGRVFDIRPDPRASLDNTKNDDFMERAWKVKTTIYRHQRPGPKGLHEVSRATILRVAYSQFDEKTDDIYDPGSLTNTWTDINTEASKFHKLDFDLCVDYAENAVLPGDTRTFKGQNYYSHLILRGESLSVIALHWLGSKTHIKDILLSNRIMIPNKNTIQAGQIINLPINDYLKEKLKN